VTRLLARIISLAMVFAIPARRGQRDQRKATRRWSGRSQWMWSGCLPSLPNLVVSRSTVRMGS